MAQADWVCPVDGAISQFGRIEKDQIFQAKGHSYSTRALVGGDAQLAAQFDDGHFACLYLSPKDYHRIHMPCAGTLRRMIYVPGDLFSVNPTTARGVPGLFARNERVVCVFDTPHGPFINVLVGATIVGSMATTWHGVVNPPRTGEVREWRYGDDKAAASITFQQGDEMGRFLLGSTVVMLWPKMPGGAPLGFNPEWQAARPIRLGEAMAQLQLSHILPASLAFEREHKTLRHRLEEPQVGRIGNAAIGRAGHAAVVAQIGQDPCQLGGLNAKPTGQRGSVLVYRGGGQQTAAAYMPLVYLGDWYCPRPPAAQCHKTLYLVPRRPPQSGGCPSRGRTRHRWRSACDQNQRR